MAVACERSFLEALDGSCKTPIAGHATIAGDAVQFRGLIARPDGSAAHDIAGTGHRKDATIIGREAGRELKQQLLPLLLADARTPVVAEALAFAIEHGMSPNGNPRLELLVETHEDAERLIEALPEVDTGLLVEARSPRMGRLAEPLWRHRAALAPTCRHVIRSAAAGASARSVEAALRLLLFFGDREYERRNIVELLVEAPNAYARFEAMLLHASSNEHFWTDEVDLLDDACDRLFGRPVEAGPEA